MLVGGGLGPVPMAMSRPAVSRPTVSARVAGAMLVARIPRHGHPGICVSGCCRSVLAIPAMAAGEGTEQGQALIVSVRSLNYFAVVDAARSGFRLRGDRDQRGYENGSENGSQGFIL